MAACKTCKYEYSDCKGNKEAIYYSHYRPKPSCDRDCIRCHRIDQEVLELRLENKKLMEANALYKKMLDENEKRTARIIKHGEREYIRGYDTAMKKLERSGR